jgi:hypothetical protein
MKLSDLFKIVFIFKSLEKYEKIPDIIKIIFKIFIKTLY